MVNRNFCIYLQEINRQNTRGLKVTILKPLYEVAWNDHLYGPGSSDKKPPNRYECQYGTQAYKPARTQGKLALPPPDFGKLRFY